MCNVNKNETEPAEILDTEKAISDTETENVETEPELTWFYDVQRETDPEAFPSDTGEYSEEIKNTYLTFPTEYITIFNDIQFKIEFHDETVFMHEYILVRKTITNLRDDHLQLQASMYTSGYFLRDDGEFLLCKNHTGQYSDSADFFGLYPGESQIHEFKFYMSSDFFEVGHTYTYVQSPDPNLIQNPTKTFEIPISINVLTKYSAPPTVSVARVFVYKFRISAEIIIYFSNPSCWNTVGVVFPFALPSATSFA